MFKLETERTFFWPVHGKAPIDDGQFADFTLDAKFRLVTQNEIDEFIAGRLPERDFLRQNLLDWRGVQDAADADLPFSEAARDKLIGIPYVRSALMAAYLEAMSGARRKN